MSRLHTTLIALILGAVATTGAFAAVKTIRLGQTVSTPKPTVAATDIASRQAKLDRWSRSLRQERSKQPPALPKLPKFAPVAAAPAAPAAPAAAGVSAAPPVKYVQSKPVIQYQHAASTSSTSTTTSTQAWADDGETGTTAGTGGDDGSATGGD